MKKRYIICICLIAAITIIMSYFKWQFKKIEMVLNVGITNIEKYGEYITLYQYEPIAFSDIKIGMKYSISDKAWTYYYDHNYDDCCHDHKVVYRVYDFLFN